MIPTNALLAETAQLVSAILPVDSQAGANNGDWVSMKDFDRCTVIVFDAGGTGTDFPVITMKQATDVSGTGAKALNFTRVDYKQGTLTSVGAYTTATQAAGNTFTPAAITSGLYLIEFQASDLDVNGGFDCLQLSIPDTGSAGAQLISALYLLRGARFQGAGLPSAIVD